MTSLGPLEERDFGGTLASLADVSQPPQVALLSQLSGPSRADVALWRRMWPTVAVERRRWLCRSLAANAEADFAVDYEPLLLAALDDEDAEVREAAIEGLWESERPALAARLVEILRTDRAENVRSAAASALAPFAQLAEMDELPAELTPRLVRALVDAATDESEEVDVRRRATEAVGFLDTPEVRALVEAHGESEERDLQAGALIAMGRNGSSRWESFILAGLDADDPILQFAAAQAAGDCGTREAVASLLPLAEGEDLEICLVAIWALGEIGGRQARRALEGLAAATDEEDVLAAIEDALAMADLDDGELRFTGLDLSAATPGMRLLPDEDGDDYARGRDDAPWSEPGSGSLSRDGRS